MFSRELPEYADVVIVGGGVVGCSIARELSRYNVEVVLLEKNPDIGFAVSGGNMGVIHPFVPQMGTLKAKMCVEGNKMFDELSRELDFKFKRVGLLIVALNIIESLFLRFVYFWLKHHGIKPEKIGREKLFQMEHHLNRKARFALYVPTAGVIFPEEYVIALAENSVENGVKIVINTEVKSIRKENDHFEIKTNKGIIKSRFVVNAAGLYSDKIMELAGLKPFEIEPGIGVMIVFNKKVMGYTKHIVAEVPFRVDPRTKGGAAGVTVDDRLIWGPNLRLVNSREDDQILIEDIESIIKKYGKLFPEIKEEHIEYYFIGVRPAAKSGDFIIGKTSIKGFINAAGIQSPGLTSSPIIAKEIVKLLKEEGLELTPNKRFNPNRKSIPRISEMEILKIEELVKKDKKYSNIVCTCGMITEGEVVEAIKRGASTIKSVFNRLGLSWSHCKESVCVYKIAKILARELGADIRQVTFEGEGTEIIVGDIGGDQD
ncbi:MAG: FAD-dependent oxidoreductase [Candidatus Njordarchaeia archaeon]